MIGPFTSSTPRRGFLGRIAAAAMGTAVAGALPAELSAESHGVADPKLEAWFARLNGKHRILFDAPSTNNGMPAVWPRVYLNTMQATYPGETASAMVIARHEGLPMVLSDAMWAKYKLGEMFNVKVDNVAATKNPYTVITTLPLPGIGVTPLLAAGVLYGVCDVALTVYAGAAAGKMKMDAAKVKAEWVAALIPGVQIVPSGVMAVGRGQEFGAQYCFAG
jgi:hypothetical protein